MLLARVPPRLVVLLVLYCSLFSLHWSPVHGVGIHKEDNEYCYTDPECGPDSDAWGGQCQNGQYQSPISLPDHPQLLPGVTEFHLRNYRGEAFRMQNNGHTVRIEILEDGGGWSGFSGGPGIVMPFPHPTWAHRLQQARHAFYKFDSAHFHWGVRDDVGSEHCFEDRCFSMEIHLVHYLNTYESMSDALESGDPNAFAVIGVMLDATPAAGEGNPVLAPIVNNLFQILVANQEEWAYINHRLDFTPFLDTKGQNYVYTYKGSLTSPECNEQVNWYVFKRPIAISSRDVEAFRGIFDTRGERLIENHRPIQSRNGRPIFLQAVKAKSLSK